MGTKEGKDRGKDAQRIEEEENRGSRDVGSKALGEGSRLLHPSLMGMAQRRGGKMDFRNSLGSGRVGRI